MNFNAYIRGVFAELPEAAASRAILAGGALRAYWDKTPVKDYDLFFRSWSDYVDASGAIQSAGWEKHVSPAQTDIFVSPSGKVFNLVGFDFGTPEHHVGRFDFRCCKIAAWMPAPLAEPFDAADVFFADYAIEDCICKLLNVVSNNGDERTLKRVLRYVRDYGYSLRSIPEDETAVTALDTEDAIEDLGISTDCGGVVSRLVRRALGVIRRTPRSSSCGSDGR